MLTADTRPNLGALDLVFLGFGGNVVKLSACYFKLYSPLAPSLPASCNPLSPAPRPSPTCPTSSSTAVQIQSFLLIVHICVLSFIFLFVCAHPMLLSPSVPLILDTHPFSFSSP